MSGTKIKQSDICLLKIVSTLMGRNGTLGVVDAVPYQNSHLVPILNECLMVS